MATAKGNIDKTQRQRTLVDRGITAFNHLRYTALERFQLRLARGRHGARYLDDNQRQRPLISVYIPTYNRAHLLRARSIPTVLAQTYSNFELIISGDCCTDDTASVVGSFKDNRIRFINLPYRKRRYPETAENHWLAGPVVAANQALRHCRGDWIARLDDDDLWMPNHLEKLVHLALNGKYEFVSAKAEFERFGRREVLDPPGARDPYYTRSPSIPGLYSPPIGPTQTWLYRSYLKFFRYNINCWRKSWNRVNDIDLSLRMFNAGVSMGFLPEVTALIIPRPGDETVGIDAYKARPEEHLSHYQFMR
jgi:glycosyltransferase involved in cell wall biosynthesis